VIQLYRPLGYSNKTKQIEFKFDKVIWSFYDPEGGTDIVLELGITQVDPDELRQAIRMAAEK
jgi:hypothetical protein